MIVMNRILALTSLVAAACLFMTARAEEKARPTVTDEQFVIRASADGLAEVELGKLAADRAGAAEVKKFGHHMVEDHTKANKELIALANKKMFPVAAQMGPTHQATAAMLARLQSNEFDRVYMTQMVKDHEEAVALFTAKAQDAKDADLKAFAAKTLPTLKEHLQMARDLAGKGREEKKP